MGLPLDPIELALVGVTFLVAGTVKGVIGLGLPSVSLGLLTATLGLQSAMALMLVPSFVTNAWQALVGGNTLRILGRLWPFLLAATLTIGLGARALARIDLAWLSALLGALLAAYALSGLAYRPPALPRRWEPWAGPLVGAVNGILTGMTGSFVVPGVAYLQSLGLPRDQLIQAMGILFTLSTAVLGVALGASRLLSLELGLASLAAVIPALLGMALGQRLRRHLSEARFRRVFFIALLALGLTIVARSLR